MNATQLAAFLKAAKDVPLLQTGGVHATGLTISPYPVKEHHDLATTKSIYTPLETILTARAFKSDAKDPATKALFDTYKKSVDTLTFRYLQTTAHIIEVGYDTPTLIMCRQTYFK